MDDSVILQLLWQRAQTGLSALAEKYGARLYAIAKNIVGDPHIAEECVNDSYLALWNSIPPHRPDPLSAYAVRITRNIALKRLRDDHARCRRSDYDVSLDELSDCIGRDTLENTVDAKLLGQLINRFLGTLNAENRNLFLRRYWFGDPVYQLAKDFHLSENTVSVRLNRIRQKLRTYLTQEGYYEK